MNYFRLAKAIGIAFGIFVLAIGFLFGLAWSFDHAPWVIDVFLYGMLVGWFMMAAALAYHWLGEKN